MIFFQPRFVPEESNGNKNKQKNFNLTFDRPILLC